MNELQSLVGWFIFESLIALICSLITLKYYHHRKYWFSYRVMIISTLVSIFHFITVYKVLVTKGLSLYFFIATLLVLIIGILYAISLIFSETRKRPWLKAAGFFLFFLGLGLLLSTTWAISSISARTGGIIGKIEQWASLIGSVIPVLFIMNFLSEKSTAKKNNTSSQESFDILMGAVALLSVVSMFIFGSNLAKESLRLSSNVNYVTDGVKILAQPFDARTYVNGQGDTMRYRLMMPLDYDSTKKYPLVVCLHGSSGCGTDNFKQIAASMPAQFFSNDENRTKYSAFIFVPQCPRLKSWGGIPDIPAVDSLVFETINALEQKLAIDVKRRYVVGNSLGGYGAWYFISKHPKMFAAALPICGGGNPELARNIVDVPVWAFHGAKDRNVPVSGSRNMIEAVKKFGGNPRYTEYADEGHDIWDKVKDTSGLFDWLFAQNRDN